MRVRCQALSIQVPVISVIWGITQDGLDVSKLLDVTQVLISLISLSTARVTRLSFRYSAHTVSSLCTVESRSS